MKPFYYIFYYGQPFSSWIVHIIIFVLAVKLKQKLENSPSRKNLILLRGLKYFVTFLFAFVVFDYFILRLFFNIYFKNILFEENIYLLIFLFLDFSIIPFFETDIEKIKITKRSENYNAIESRILYGRIPYWYFKLRKFYCISALIRIPYSLLLSLLLAFSSESESTLSYPTREYYEESIYELRMQKKEENKGAYITRYSAADIPFFHPKNNEVYINTDCIFKYSFHKTFSVKHFILHKVLKMPEKYLIKIGEFQRDKIIPFEILYAFNNDSIYNKGISATTKIKVFQFYNIDYKCPERSEYYNYYSVHDITEDSLDFSITKGLNVKEVSYNYPADDYYNFNRIPLYRPSYLDFKQKIIR